MSPALSPSQKKGSLPFFLESASSLLPVGTGTHRHLIVPSPAASSPYPGHKVQRAQKDQETRVPYRGQKEPHPIPSFAKQGPQLPTCFLSSYCAGSSSLRKEAF